MRTYQGSLEVWTGGCCEVAEAALRDASVRFVRHDFAGEDQHRFDVEAITAEQYEQVVEAMHAVGTPGVEWNFPLD